MSNSILYAANTATQSVTSGNIINFGSAVRRYGCNCNINAGNVEVTGTGYYDIDTNITFTSSAGTVVITCYNQGVAIPGATASITAVADTVYSVSIPAVIRQKCNCTSTVTVVATGTTLSVTNASVVVDKL